ncbi:MAG: TIGR00341 family protein [Rhodothermaceae bacterium]|nr:TIGR00341 family protein [Rhodothermaceae bacterium]
MPTDDPVLAEASDDDSPMEEAARRHFGLRTWDRPALYRETAEAATDTDLPFWLVLLLSGAIATLGLVLNSTAVVIGAMLVAPLLGPLLGLSLALAVGDGRLFVQTAATILLGAAGIVALAALLTVLLPFHSVTDEIASRTRPTTLDLGIAVFSGLAGAVVTASREARLSASIPGVAVAVALVPPLGVAGFGIAIGKVAIAKGALLLFGANLAGIVLSGMLVFLIIGMHRAPVVKAASAWHATEGSTGFAARIHEARWLNRLPGLASPLARVLLVVAFMAAVAVPLTSSLRQVVREGRVSQAIDAVEAQLRAEDAYVIDREVTYGEAGSSARLRVATEAWIPDAAESELAAQASEEAGEPVTLVLEQILASSGDLAAFADALPERPAVRSVPQTTEPASVAATLASVRGRLAGVLGGLALPDGVQVVEGALDVSTDGQPTLTVVYAAARRLPPEAEQLLARQAAQALQLDPGQASARAIVTAPRALPDSAAATSLAALLARTPRLGVVLDGDTAAVRDARARLLAAGAPASRIRLTPSASPPRARLTLAPDSARAGTAP